MIVRQSQSRKKQATVVRFKNYKFADLILSTRSKGGYSKREERVCCRTKRKLVVIENYGFPNAAYIW